MLSLCCNLEKFIPNMIITHKLLHNVCKNPQQPLSCDLDWSIAMLRSPSAVGTGMCLNTTLVAKLTWPFCHTFTPHSMEFTKKIKPKAPESHGYILRARSTDPKLLRGFCARKSMLIVPQMVIQRGDANVNVFKWVIRCKGTPHSIQICLIQTASDP